MANKTWRELAPEISKDIRLSLTMLSAAIETIVERAREEAYARAAQQISIRSGAHALADHIKKLPTRDGE